MVVVGGSVVPVVSGAADATGVAESAPGTDDAAGVAAPDAAVVDCAVAAAVGAAVAEGSGVSSASGAAVASAAGIAELPPSAAPFAAEFASVAPFIGTVVCVGSSGGAERNAKYKPAATNAATIAPITRAPVPALGP